MEGDQLIFKPSSVAAAGCFLGVHLIETDSRFPHRTNVQFMEILDRQNVRIEMWERGAGYTLASGSSSTAAAAVAYRLGLCDPALTAHMPVRTLNLLIHKSAGRVPQ
jgi:diaminopimelate epimerase